jgi:hypothetical protein
VDEVGREERRPVTIGNLISWSDQHVVPKDEVSLICANVKSSHDPAHGSGARTGSPRDLLLV